MYENHEGDFAYMIRRRELRGAKAVWHWEVRRRASHGFVECGISPRSHDAAETAALDAIFRRQGNEAPAGLGS